MTQMWTATPEAFTSHPIPVSRRTGNPAELPCHAVTRSMSVAAWARVHSLLAAAARDHYDSANPRRSLRMSR